LENLSSLKARQITGEYSPSSSTKLVDSNPVEPEPGSTISPNKHTKRKGAKRELKEIPESIPIASPILWWQASLSNFRCFVEL
jgi:hypothetical protein